MIKGATWFQQNTTVNVLNGIVPVSYTHLDVYKRQRHRCSGCQVALSVVVLPLVLLMRERVKLPCLSLSNYLRMQQLQIGGGTLPSECFSQRLEL